MNIGFSPMLVQLSQAKAVRFQGAAEEQAALAEYKDTLLTLNDPGWADLGVKHHEIVKEAFLYAAKQAAVLESSAFNIAPNFVSQWELALNGKMTQFGSILTEQANECGAGLNSAFLRPILRDTLNKMAQVEPNPAIRQRAVEVSRHYNF